MPLRRQAAESNRIGRRREKPRPCGGMPQIAEGGIARGTAPLRRLAAESMSMAGPAPLRRLAAALVMRGSAAAVLAAP